MASRSPWPVTTRTVPWTRASATMASPPRRSFPFWTRPGGRHPGGLQDRGGRIRERIGRRSRPIPRLSGMGSPGPLISRTSNPDVATINRERTARSTRTAEAARTGRATYARRGSTRPSEPVSTRSPRAQSRPKRGRSSGAHRPRRVRGIGAHAALADRVTGRRDEHRDHDQRDRVALAGIDVEEARCAGHARISRSGSRRAAPRSPAPRQDTP